MVKKLKSHVLSIRSERLKNLFLLESNANTT